MNNVPSRTEIETGLIEVLTDMTRDWDFDAGDEIGPATRLIDDLGFESIDLVQLVVAIEEKFGVRGLSYEDVLMEEGGYVTELRVSQLVDFLNQSIAAHRAG